MLRVLLCILLFFLVGVNLTAFFLCGLDKWKACRGRRRIRERTLLLLALSFGAPGLFAGMILFHHKTSDKAFVPWVPLLLIAQLFAAAWLSGRFLL